ncbi:hypothetical protein [Arcobacter sp. s6]|uniref:hypothetical protein n=1 Tax=Arcobacter sp. s6 TaxID=3230363 RepID=UPI0034A09FDF
MKELTPYITLILGAIIGFSTTILRDYIQDKKKNIKEQNELALKRLEEIFILTNKLTNIALTNFSNLMAGKETNINEEEVSGNRSFKIRAYFPELKETNNKYITKYTEFRLIQMNIYLKYADSKFITNEEKIDLEKLTKEFTEISNEMLGLIIKKTEKYN